MTLASTAEALNEMCSMVMTVESAQLALPGKAFTPPNVTVAWARVSFEHAGHNQATLSNANGKRRFRSDGTLMIEVFYPLGDATGAYEWAQSFADLFEGKESESGIWFREVGIFESKDRASGWFRLDVLANFEYDRIK